MLIYDSISTTMPYSQRLLAITVFIAIFVLSIPPCQSKRLSLSGPVSAQLEKVIDGDTIRARALIWLGQEVQVTVRLKGVDTPELRGRCPQETALANKARQFTANWLSNGRLQLSRIKQGKYGGRVVAKIANSHGRDLGRALLEHGLARPYSGKKRRSWCHMEKQR